MKKLLFVFTLAAGIVIVFGCSGLKEAHQPVDPYAPDWFVSQPEDQDILYGVGIGEDMATQTARNAADEAALSDITDQLDMKIGNIIMLSKQQVGQAQDLNTVKEICKQLALAVVKHSKVIQRKTVLKEEIFKVFTRTNISIPLVKEELKSLITTTNFKTRLNLNDALKVAMDREIGKMTGKRETK